MKVSTGETVKFGRFGGEEIEWLVLASTGEEAFLLSKYALACRPYHESAEPVTWASSSLRAWLNGAFFSEAFTAQEQEKILSTTVENRDHPDQHTPGGEDTEDRVFVLSLAAVANYFPERASRICFPTQHAIDGGAHVATVEGAEGACWWWLRSPGRDKDRATCVRSAGDLDENGRPAVMRAIAVRPVLWLDLIAIDKEIL